MRCWRNSCPITTGVSPSRLVTRKMLIDAWGRATGWSPERACGEQRLCGAFCQSVLPTAHAGVSGRAWWSCGNRGASDGSMAIRFGTRYLKYAEIPKEDSSGGSAPAPPEFDAKAAGAEVEKDNGVTHVSHPVALAHSRLADARVALLRSPILLPVVRVIAPTRQAVQHRIIPGANPSNRSSEPTPKADISIGDNCGHFYWGLTVSRILHDNRDLRG